MGYNDRPPATISLGCLPATIFGFVVASPLVFLSVMTECWDEAGRRIRCPGARPTLLIGLALTALLCLLITWATNRMVRAFAAKGRNAAWGVLGGIAVGALVVGLLYALLALT